MIISAEKSTETDAQKAAIREVVEDLHLRLGVPYSSTPYNQRLHELCCRQVIDKGYLMGTEPAVPSLRPYLPAGVVIAATAYAHLENEATRVFIALLTALAVFVDGMYKSDSRAMRVFIDRFARGEKQDWRSRSRKHFDPFVASAVLMGVLSGINALTLEFQMHGMEISRHAEGYLIVSTPDDLYEYGLHPRPNWVFAEKGHISRVLHYRDWVESSYLNYVRQMTGASEAYALMGFPRHIPLQQYIECIPEATLFVSCVNDVLSFYKEEIDGDTINHISILAQREGISKMTAFQKLADKGIRAAAQVEKILEMDREAHDAWQKFKAGFLGFHTSLEVRYRLGEVTS